MQKATAMVAFMLLILLAENLSISSVANRARCYGTNLRGVPGMGPLLSQAVLFHYS
jgi:hypothetical protein